MSDTETNNQENLQSVLKNSSFTEEELKQMALDIEEDESGGSNFVYEEPAPEPEPPKIVETPNDNQDIQELDKSIQKPKKPRTEKQKAALKKAQETRRANLKKKKEGKAQSQPTHKASAKKVGGVLQEVQEVEPVFKKRGRKKQPRVVYEDDESSDEEVIVVKRKPRKRKQKKKIIIEDNESSTEEEEEIIKEIQKPKRKYKKKVNLSVPDSDEEDEAYAYTYQEQAPLKYSDVFRFQ